MRLLFSLAVSWALVAGTAAEAQHVSLDLRGGQVTLDARDATLSEILREWTRVGGTKILNLRSPEVAGPRVTLLLRDMTERQALDILLREVGGYLLFARRDATQGASEFEQILLVPRSSVPASPPASASGRTLASPSGVNPLMPPMVRAPQARAPEPADREEEEEEESDDDSASIASASVESANEPPQAESAPAPGRGRNAGQVNASTDQPPPTPLLPPSLEPDAANPFGRVAGSARPGTVVPAGPPPGVLYPPVTNPEAMERRPPPAPAR